MWLKMSEITVSWWDFGTLLRCGGRTTRVDSTDRPRMLKHGSLHSAPALPSLSLHQRRGDDNDLPSMRVFNSPLLQFDSPDVFTPVRASSNNTATHLVPQRVQFVDGL